MPDGVKGLIDVEEDGKDKLMVDVAHADGVVKAGKGIQCGVAGAEAALLGGERIAAFENVVCAIYEPLLSAPAASPVPPTQSGFSDWNIGHEKVADQIARWVKLILNFESAKTRLL